MRNFFEYINIFAKSTALKKLKKIIKIKEIELHMNSVKNSDRFKLNEIKNEIESYLIAYKKNNYLIQEIIYNVLFIISFIFLFYLIFFIHTIAIRNTIYFIAIFSSIIGFSICLDIELKLNEQKIKIINSKLEKQSIEK